MILGRQPCLTGELVRVAKAKLLQWEPGAMESISALKLSMLACGHSNMPLIALISGKFRVSSQDLGRQPCLKGELVRVA